MTNGRDTASIVLDEYTETPVDTVRSEFRNPRKGVTSVTVVQVGKPDTLQFLAHGHYYSGMVPITFSSDRARELILIPNTEQGLALGVGELLYLDTAGKLSVIHIQSPNVGDIDSDGVFEVFDARAGAALHLDRGAKKWVVVPDFNRKAGTSK